ncbi:uncharacterized protein A1O5_03130 [Cladophialophora psammophila CBS 110553]|uniref:CENP-V/GFA domain-containing protein n=1 Tax=Cladophialophora psammophila CBS 110553 TaxID=1182543 RepID=W9X7U2_9EURO|nr:uncharacterized protein A1O5_03130 [Cladophialophora psammophila CBS 110553]EXJ73370.1 hypothetical protein A1O5_03130 [Cladophialophora psammophila CBS 110553]
MPEDKSQADKIDHGRCLCGAVTFTVVGEPIYNVQYTLHTGSDRITTYVDRATQSGQPLSRAFCKICGSKVHALTPLNEAIVSIPAGVLEHSPTSWAPQKEQFCEVRCAWVPDFGGAVTQRFSRGPTPDKVEGVTTQL